MPRPKGSRNKATLEKEQQSITEIQPQGSTPQETLSIEDDIAKTKADIEAAEWKLRRLQDKLNRLNELQAKESQDAIMSAIAASGKPLDEILALIKGLSAKEEPAEEPTEEPIEEPTEEPKPNTEE